MSETHKHYFHFDNSLGLNPIVNEYFTLWQVGDLFLAPDEFVSVHDQYCFEITFVERGCGNIFAGNQNCIVGKNDVQFSFQGDNHSLHAAHDSPLRFFYIALTPKPNTICETIINSLSEYCRKNGCIFPFPEIFDAVKDLLSEFYNKNIFYKERIESFVINILISIYRKAITETSKKRIESPQRKDELIYNILNFIDSNPNRLITLKEISENFFYGYDYISRAFKDIMQVSLRDYLYDIRLNTAKKLLLSSDKSITEISDELGYSCIHSFSRSFKAKFGVSPEQYKILQNDTEEKES